MRLRETHAAGVRNRLFTTPRSFELRSKKPLASLPGRMDIELIDDYALHKMLLCLFLQAPVTAIAKKQVFLSQTAHQGATSCDLHI